MAAGFFTFQSLLGWVEMLASVFVILGFWNILTCWTAGAVESKIGSAANTAFDDWLRKKGDKKADEAGKSVGKAGEAAEKGDTPQVQKELDNASKELQDAAENSKKEIEDLKKQLEELRQQPNQSAEELAKLREAYNALLKAQQKVNAQEQTAEWLKKAALNPQKLLPPHVEQIQSNINISKPTQELKTASDDLREIKERKKATSVKEINELEQKVKSIKTALATQKRYAIAENKYGQELLKIAKTQPKPGSSDIDNFKNKLRREARIVKREQARIDVKKVYDMFLEFHNELLMKSVNQPLIRAGESEGETLMIVGKYLKNLTNTFSWPGIQNQLNRLIEVTRGWLIVINELNIELNQFLETEKKRIGRT